MDNPNDSPRWITAAEAYENLGGGGTPGGDDTQIQYNHDGVFSGSPDLTWDGDTLGVGTFDFDGMKIDAAHNRIILKGSTVAVSIPSNPNVIYLGSPDSGAGIEIDVTDGVIIQTNIPGSYVVVQLSGGGAAFFISGGPVLLNPSSEPSSPVEGMIYAGTDHHIYYYNGTTWKQLDNTL